LGKSEILPDNDEDLSVLLKSHLISSAIYELGGELRKKSERLRIPILGILTLMGESHFAVIGKSGAATPAMRADTPVIPDKTS
jgi:hypothetical protein